MHPPALQIGAGQHGHTDAVRRGLLDPHQSELFHGAAQDGLGGHADQGGLHVIAVGGQRPLQAVV